MSSGVPRCPLWHHPTRSGSTSQEGIMNTIDSTTAIGTTTTESRRAVHRQHLSVGAPSRRQSHITSPPHDDVEHNRHRIATVITLFHCIWVSTDVTRHRYFRLPSRIGDRDDTPRPPEEGLRPMMYRSEGVSRPPMRSFKTSPSENG
ncbi:hypothetical protein EF294_14450 [Gordonia oryzae]|uniref:Uncharacterized protein n=1 Tax=Gordonia oryzae TaxID=2487349 RepID=A0A3N4G8G1_9ACTN|nr:hypothetical protein EF294_14450 [Gordonia oryzae]